MSPKDANHEHVSNLDRRGILRLIGLVGAAGFGLIHGLAHAAPPKETGLSFEGLLKREPGFQPRTIAPLPYAGIPGFLSNAQLARNYAIYRTAFSELSEVESALATVPRDAQHCAAYAALRQRQLAAGNSVLLHEFYFRNLTARPTPPSRYVIANVNEHMGSLDDWREDFLAVARVAEEWAALVYDPYDDRWHNVALNATNAGGWVGANPLIVCDVAGHAWSIDYKDRATYMARFLDHVDWSVVADRYRKVDRQ
jgi:Fe-Mn family superoxide dismutase